MIDVRGLTKRFHDKKRGEILGADRVTFHAGAGQVFGLLGRNGAGKTTTLRLLSTILQPDDGTAVVNGFDLLKQGPDVRRSIGFHTSDTKLYDRLTGRESLEFYGRLQGLSAVEARTRVEELSREFDLTEFVDTRVARLSGGQKQRISLARVVVHRPPVLILDEPTVGLDIMAAREVVRFVKRARGEGHCVLLSTHIMAEVERLCDEVAIIEKGRILAQGTLPDLKRQYQEEDIEEVFFKLVGEVV
ncbi:MAG TPA: ABC transporter ATP-binding protein [Candidatus Saccharimonadales bacterium]|nr:ABC transporter ATP-binding protein [Candidatus Saccharimonadales bacterium]